MPAHSDDGHPAALRKCRLAHSRRRQAEDNLTRRLNSFRSDLTGRLGPFRLITVGIHDNRFALPPTFFPGRNPRHQDRTTRTQLAAETEDRQARCLGQMVNLAPLPGVVKQEIGSPRSYKPSMRFRQASARCSCAFERKTGPIAAIERKLHRNEFIGFGSRPARKWATSRRYE